MPVPVASVVAVCGLGGLMARGILAPQPGVRPHPLHLEGGFFTTGPLGKSLILSDYVDLYRFGKICIKYC